MQLKKIFKKIQKKRTTTVHVLGKNLNKTNMPTLKTVIQHITRVLALAIKAKEHLNWKGRSPGVTFSDEIILYRENPRLHQIGVTIEKQI